jgi:hypothetical protein
MPTIQMKPLPQSIIDKLLENGRASAASEGGIDHVPVVKLFTPDAGATWLLSELDPDYPDIAFGLCDLGLGCAELGSVALSEIASVRGKLGLPVERDEWFKTDKTVGQWADVARNNGDSIAAAAQAIAAGKSG